MMKRIVLLLAMLAMVALAAAPALAHHGPPENPGVETGPQHANSICAYSGLNDDPDEEFPDNGQTQSYGQLVSKLVKVGVNVNAEEGRAAPGFACNAHLFPYPPGPPPPE
jgi:hypothetical protein